MTFMFKILTIISCLSLASAGHASDGDTAQARFSAPFTTESALDAFTQAKAETDAIIADLQSRYIADPDSVDLSARPYPHLYDASWPNEACTDIQSLLPSPFDGWGIPALTNQTIAITPEAVSVSYYAFTDDQPDDSFPKDSVSFQMSTSPGDVGGFETFLGMPEMRDVMFQEGPYGYPVMKMQRGALIGSVLVYVDGTNDAAADAYLSEIIGCAVKSGFVAKGIDATTLRDTP